MFRFQMFIIILAILGMAGCKKSATHNSSTTPPPTNPNLNFVKGADLSWLTQMEAANIPFFDSTGTQMDCMQIMKGLGMNAIRLRAWVNPTDGWCNTHDLVTKAIRAKTLGFKIMIDFHYSDTWADPGHQTKPAAWSNYGFDSLEIALYQYTIQVMDTLKSVGVIPTWAQVGNETDNGMLWNDGMASTNMGNFAALVSLGYNAIKSVNVSTQVIVHVSDGFNDGLFRWVFDGLKSNNAKWDIIGMSLYPSIDDWQTLDQECLSTMNDMVARYQTPVMICEVGMPVSPADTSKLFLDDIISKTRSLPNNMGLGVFYWEPESYNNWQGYGLGAFDNTGRPTIALNAFRD